MSGDGLFDEEEDGDIEFEIAVDNSLWVRHFEDLLKADKYEDDAVRQVHKRLLFKLKRRAGAFNKPR